MSERRKIRIRDAMKTDFDMVDGMDRVQTAQEMMPHVETKSLMVKKRMNSAWSCFRISFDRCRT
jgi:hypothetical protein